MATISLDDIWTRFKVGGDVRAREALIDNYGYLVKITAGRIAGGVPPSLDREDLISAGMIGLINNGLILAGLESSQQQVVRGAIIILAVALARKK